MHGIFGEEPCLSSVSLKLPACPACSAMHTLCVGSLLVLDFRLAEAPSLTPSLSSALVEAPSLSCILGDAHSVCRLPACHRFSPHRGSLLGSLLVLGFSPGGGSLPVLHLRPCTLSLSWIFASLRLSPCPACSAKHTLSAGSLLALDFRLPEAPSLCRLPPCLGSSARSHGVTLLVPGLGTAPCWSCTLSWIFAAFKLPPLSRIFGDAHSRCRLRPCPGFSPRRGSLLDSLFVLDFRLAEALLSLSCMLGNAHSLCRLSACPGFSPRRGSRLGCLLVLDVRLAEAHSLSWIFGKALSRLPPSLPPSPLGQPQMRSCVESSASIAYPKGWSLARRLMHLCLRGHISGGIVKVYIIVRRVTYKKNGHTCSGEG